MDWAVRCVCTPQHSRTAEHCPGHRCRDLGGQRGHQGATARGSCTSRYLLFKGVGWLGCLLRSPRCVTALPSLCYPDFIFGASWLLLQSVLGSFVVSQARLDEDAAAAAQAAGPHRREFPSLPSLLAQQARFMHWYTLCCVVVV